MQNRTLLWALFLIISFTSAEAICTEAGPWGDQGDGTYRNPILNADYPDVDIEHVGGKYYMITSTNHYAPGMTLLDSKDLVNWRIIGHVWEKLTWAPKYNWDKMGGYGHGVWAGDLACHDGKWYCYFIDFSSGLYVSTAEKITGPWSQPTCMMKKKAWTDPAVFWDEQENQAYLICNFGRDQSVKNQRVNQTRLFKMSWDGLRLLDDGKPIYSGPGAEAAKIYKINGLFYIFMAEWRQSDRKQIVLRGKSLYGPMERRVLMERGNGVERSVCQGALVQAPDGSWWLSHQLVQNRKRTKQDLAGPTTGESYEGRSQWLVPVKWKDGWPVVGVDPDGNGIGNTVHKSRKPIKGHPITAPQTNDDFDSPVLGPQWQWNHNPRDDHWSLTERPGHLRLKAGVPAGDGGFWNAANTQQAGFCHHSGQYILLGVRADDDGARRLVFNYNGNQTQGSPVTADIIYFHTNIAGDRATLSYSLDGRTPKQLGHEFQLIFGRWRGDRLGFYCWNDKTDAGHIDIDSFAYTYDGPRQ